MPATPNVTVHLTILSTEDYQLLLKTIGLAQSAMVGQARLLREAGYNSAPLEDAAQHLGDATAICASSRLHADF